MSNNELENKKMQLEIVLAEHKYLTDHFLSNNRLLIQVYTIGFAAITAISSFVFTQRAYDVLLVMPFLTFTLFGYLLWLTTTNKNIHAYIREDIEDRKIRKIVGCFPDIDCGYKKFWLATEHWYQEREKPGKRFSEFSAIIFLIGSLLLPVWHSVVQIIKFFVPTPKLSCDFIKLIEPINSAFPGWIHLIIITTYFITILLAYRAYNRHKPK